MPNIYTSDLYEGKISTTSDFIKNAAKLYFSTRADDGYERETLAESIAERKELMAKSYKELEEITANEFNYAILESRNRLFANYKKGKKYQQIIDDLDAWSPPEQYLQFKIDTLRQITESKKYDCIEFIAHHVREKPMAYRKDHFRYLSERIRKSFSCIKENRQRITNSIMNIEEISKLMTNID